MDKFLPLKPKKEPKIYPYFRKKRGKRVQDGFRVVWYEGDERKREKVATEEEAELLCAGKAKAYAFVDTGLRQVTTRLTQGHMVHVELALRRLHEHQYLNFDVPEEADQLVRAVDWFIRNYRAPVENMPTVKSFVPLFLKAKYFGAIRALLYFASSKSEFVETPWISHNPAVDMPHPPKPSVPRRQRYTLDEVRRLIQVSVYLRCAPSWC